MNRVRGLTSKISLSVNVFFLLLLAYTLVRNIITIFNTCMSFFSIFSDDRPLVRKCTCHVGLFLIFRVTTSTTLHNILPTLILYYSQRMRCAGRRKSWKKEITDKLQPKYKIYDHVFVYYIV